jgi:hypothetical protein
MKKPPVSSWRREYERLRQGLARTGYISQGSVVDRSRLKNPRSGYQWTRKAAQKTITVALTAQQFRALRQAIQNRQALAKTLDRMERLTRKIIFATLPDTPRRKSLSAKVLGLN